MLESLIDSLWGEESDGLSACWHQQCLGFEEKPRLLSRKLQSSISQMALSNSWSPARQEKISLHG